MAEVSRTLLYDYIWGTPSPGVPESNAADFSWDSGTAEKTWDEAGAYDIVAEDDETLAFAEAQSKLVTQATFAESFSFAEAHARAISQAIAVSLAFAEQYDDIIGYIQNFAETLTFAEARASTPGMMFAETFTIFDALLRNAEMVLFDLHTKDVAWSEEQMLAYIARGSPVGYAPRRRFVPGDYEFQKAIMGVTFTVPATSGQPAVIDLTHNVDMPDVYDSATQSIPASITAVSFNKVFTAPPEVTVFQKSGAKIAQPKFSGAITKTGFSVWLDAVDGTGIIAGDITWHAHGR